MESAIKKRVSAFCATWKRVLRVLPAGHPYPDDGMTEADCWNLCVSCELNDQEFGIPPRRSRRCL